MDSSTTALSAVDLVSGRQVLVEQLCCDFWLDEPLAGQ